ncbi:MAG: hypothetical protein RIF33_26965 [Cyclobacteriaceae bacterium]
MIKLFLQVLLLVVVTSVQARSGNKWRLIYENDEEGRAVSGNKQDLIKAVQNADDIKVSWVHLISEEPLQKIEHTAEANYLTIINDGTVLAQLKPFIGQSPDFDSQHIILDENIEMAIVVATSGKNNSIKRNTITGEIIAHNSGKRAYRWFVRD